MNTFMNTPLRKLYFQPNLSQCSISMPPENVRKLLVFRRFQGLQKWKIELKWVKCVFYLFQAQAEAKSSHQRCSVKKVFLKISQYSQESNCFGVSFLIKLQTESLQLC